MIHPSYVELMNSVNQDCLQEEPVVKSRYSIVTATARRARQLIDHADSRIDDTENRKPLSIAVEEINEGAVKILTDASAAALKQEIAREQLLAEAMKAESQTEEADASDAEPEEATGAAADPEEAASDEAAQSEEADGTKEAEAEEAADVE